MAKKKKENSELSSRIINNRLLEEQEDNLDKDELKAVRRYVG